MSIESKTFTLKYPIPVKDDSGKTKKGQYVNILTLGRFKAKHLKLLPEGFMGNEGENVKPHEMIPIIAGLADLSVETVEELDFVDLITITNGLESFLSESQAAGEKQSGE